MPVKRKIVIDVELTELPLKVFESEEFRKVMYAVLLDEVDSFSGLKALSVEFSDAT